MGLEKKLKKFFRNALTVGMLSSSLVLSYSCGGKDSGVTDPSESHPTQPEKINRAPIITSNPPTTCKKDLPYLYTILANDPDGDSLTYSFDGPFFLIMQHNSLLTMCPGLNKTTSFPVTVKVSDGKLITKQDYSLTVIQPDKTYLLSQSEMDQIVNITDSSIVFSQPISYTPGDVIVADINQKTPFGMSRKILDISSDKRIAETRNASIAETYGSGKISISDQISSSDGFPGISNEKKGYEKAISFDGDFNTVLFDLDKNENTRDDQLIAKGSFAFQLDLKGELDLDARKFLFQTPVSEKVDISIVSNTSGFPQGLEKKIFDRYFAPIIPSGISPPLIIFPHVQAYVGIKPGRIRNLEARVVQEANFTPSLSYENGSFKALKDFSNQFDFSFQNPAVDFNVEAYLYLRPEFLIWGVTGAFTSSSSGLIFESKNKNSSLKFHEIMGVGIDGGVFADWLPQYAVQLLDYEKLLSGDDGNPPISSENKLAFVRIIGSNADIYTMNSDGSDSKNVTNSSPHSWNIHPSLSFDGKTIAFASKIPFSNSSPELWLMNFEDSNKNRIVQGSSGLSYPAVSPEGNEIVYFSSSFGGQINIVNIDGSSSRRFLNETGHNYSGLSWSSNGSLAFASTRNSAEGEIYTVKRDGTGITRLTNNSYFDGSPSWSPNGDKISFTSTRTGNPDIWIMNSDGANQTNLTNSADYESDSCWSSDGEKIFFVSRPAGTYSESNEIWSFDLKTSVKTRLTNNSYNEGSLSCSR